MSYRKQGKERKEVFVSQKGGFLNTNSLLMLCRNDKSVLLVSHVVFSLYDIAKNKSF